MEFGIFDSFDLGRGDDSGDLLEKRLAFAAEADKLGIHRYHVTEHHGTTLSVCPSPNIFLAALSQRTQHMNIGALVNVLPTYDPFRLAEEIATLDQLSGGRLDFGVGAGVSPYELEIFGVAAAQAKPVYIESLAAITSALRTGRMTHEGKLLRSYDAELSVLPVQRPYPPLWYASSNAWTAEWAGSHGIHFVGPWRNGAFVDIVKTYWEHWEKNRNAQDRLNAHVAEPRVGIKGTVVIGESEEHALDIYHRANDLWCERVLQLWHEHDDHRLDNAFTSEAHLAGGTACVGTAESVRDQIVHQVETAKGVNYYESSFYFGDMSLDEALHNLRAFTEIVAPALTSAGR
jgi:alkanesulfonate monooxygenase SsuD/methylene tetrahydromethanopterin reductase-like flavin-dependent oxidoreductase (luciferase family)